jgi:CRP/FNR family transcriptional regulator, cyclic AMP receptor protein
MGKHLVDLEFNYGFDSEPDLNDACLRKLCKFGKALTFSRTEHLYYQGDPADHLYVLKAGVVKATHGDENGHEWLVRFHGPGSLMGIEALRPLMFRDANLVVLDDVEAVGFKRDEFLKLISFDADLAVIVVQLLARRIHVLHSRVEGVAGKSVEQRVARALLQLYAEFDMRSLNSAEPVLLVTHEELATLVLSRRQYITAILRRFAEDGLIENKRRQIRIINPERLVEIYSE